jgi:hypothetical protein
MMTIGFRLFSRKVTAEIPTRLWRRILEAHDGDEELASVALATAVLVAAENIAEPHRPRPAPVIVSPLCPTCGHRHEPPISGRAALEREQTPVVDVEQGYLVTESPLSADMPVDDPWKTARD